MMGGRGSKANVQTSTPKYGARMNPSQYREAVHAKANFILRELEKNDAIQIILKRSFRGGVPIFEVSSDGINVIVQRGLKGETVKQLNTMKTQFENRKNSARNEMDKGKTWSGYDESRAEHQVYMQALKTLEEAIEELKKRK